MVNLVGIIKRALFFADIVDDGGYGSPCCLTRGHPEPFNG